MTTAHTMDTFHVVEEIQALYRAGCQIVRITAPSLKEANNLENIRNSIVQKDIRVALVADIHYLPAAALRAVEFVDKVRINPGNFVESKDGDGPYTEQEYHDELRRTADALHPLLLRARELQRSIRIGVNHGSLSRRILDRYGNTPEGMVASALETIRLFRDQKFHDIIVSLKSSHPSVMVEAYRKLVKEFLSEGFDYPLHLGVTEAGDKKDGTVRSALGIGLLLSEGIGDTIRVSLTEDSVEEIPVARSIIDSATFSIQSHPDSPGAPVPADDRDPPYFFSLPAVENTRIAHGSTRYPLLFLDAPPGHGPLEKEECNGYVQNGSFVPGNLETVAPPELLSRLRRLNLIEGTEHAQLLFIDGHSDPNNAGELEQLEKSREIVEPVGPGGQFADNRTSLVMVSTTHLSVSEARWKLHRIRDELQQQRLDPLLLLYTGHGQEPSVSRGKSSEPFIYRNAPLAGSLLLDGIIDGVVWKAPAPVSGDAPSEDSDRFLEDVLSIFQAADLRKSRADYISCPSCGRTYFDIQRVSKEIREKTWHLRGVKIGIMGCIVNGPGEMADADFGYVGSGPGRVDLYRGHTRLERNLPESEAQDRLIELIRGEGRWVDRVEPGHQ